MKIINLFENLRAKKITINDSCLRKKKLPEFVVFKLSMFAYLEVQSVEEGGRDECSAE